ncbi:sigma-70 family RNA polymerase sigma factor [Candidatus Vidania fulgoroideorum]
MRSFNVLSFDSERNIFIRIESSIFGIIRIVSLIPFLSFSILKILKKDFNNKFKYEKLIVDFNSLRSAVCNTTIVSSVSNSNLRANLLLLYYKLKCFNFKNHYDFIGIYKILNKIRYSNSFVNYINNVYKNLLFRFLRLEKCFIRIYFYLMNSSDIRFFESRILNVTFLNSISYIRRKIQVNNNTFMLNSSKVYKKLLIIKKKIFVNIGILKDKSNEYFTEISYYKGNRKKIIESNQRLIISVSKNYRNKGLPFSDLLQEGNIGLIKSIERFDYRKGYKFSTYSTWWIRQSITRSIADSSRLIRVPVHMTEILSKINNLKKDYFIVNNKYPSTEYIQHKLNISLDKIKKVTAISKIPVSLESKINEKKGNATYEEVLSINYNNSERLLSDKEVNNSVSGILCFLNIRESTILKMRFGLYGNRSMTLEEIGKVFGVTRERIRQIENNSLNKIRNSSIINTLRNIFKGR